MKVGMACRVFSRGSREAATAAAGPRRERSDASQGTDSPTLHGWLALARLAAPEFGYAMQTQLPLVGRPGDNRNTRRTLPRLWRDLSAEQQEASVRPPTARHVAAEAHARAMTDLVGLPCQRPTLPLLVAGPDVSLRPMHLGQLRPPR